MPITPIAGEPPTPETKPSEAPIRRELPKPNRV